MSGNMLTLYVTAMALVAISGIYYLLVTTNLIRALIGLELVTKSITLGLVLVGRITGNTGLGQALAITLIVIEVVVMVVAAGLILLSHKRTGTVDVRDLRGIKG
jgi:multisubunit Na+/H+ antiporter MnhC subunit